MGRIRTPLIALVIALLALISPVRTGTANQALPVIQKVPSAGDTASVISKSVPDILLLSPSINQAGLNLDGLPADSGSRPVIAKEKPFDKIDLHPFSLINNVWGAPTDEKLNSAVYSNPQGGFGWYWNRPEPLVRPGATSVAPLYPAIRIGGNCLERIQSAGFPISLKDVTSLVLQVNYNYPQPPKGSYDLSYDIFLSDPGQPDSRPKINAEVMIWLENTAGQPAKCYKGDYSDGTYTFQLYSWKMADGRTYYSFIIKGQPPTPGQYTINANALLSQLNLDSSLLMHGLEFGTEVWQGSGKIQVNDFVVSLNGHTL